jgi:hypothetical protein
MSEAFDHSMMNTTDAALAIRVAEIATATLGGEP